MNLTNKNLTKPNYKQKIFLNNFIVSIIFFLIVISGIFWAKPSYEAGDQNRNHLPQVETFVEKPFTIGSSYPATIPMTPGHHIVLSWVSKYWANGIVGADVFPIRIVNATFGLGLILACWWLIYLNNPGKILESTYLVLPLLFSPYVLGPSIWVMTDNGALLWACITLIILSQENRSGWFLCLASLFSALAVFWRQTYIFLIVPMLWKVLQEFLRKRNWQLLLASILIPLVSVIYFMIIWGGLVPPELEFLSKKLNFSALTYILSLFGAYGIFYLGYLSSELKNVFQQRKEIWALVFVLLIGGLTSILIPLKLGGIRDNADGILLKLSSQFPVFYERSILITILSSLGAAIIYLLFKSFLRREGKTVESILFSSESIVLVFTLSWIPIFVVSRVAFQRYYDSLVIITLSFLASRQTSKNPHSYLGVLVLSGLFLFLSLAKFSGIAANW